MGWSFTIRNENIITENTIGVFIEEMSDSGQRVLHPAELLSSTDGVYSMKLQTDKPAEEPGEAITVYYQKGRSFLKQWARIESWDASGGFAEIQATLLGEPCSAEQREDYRVSAVMADLCVDLADETGCKLMDVSAVGCSAIATGTYTVGQLVPLTIYNKGEPIVGEAIVRGVKQLDDGRTRYGLACLLDRDSESKFKKALRDITMMIQRSQLQRLSRA